MKTLVTLLLAFITTSAFASCPNLAGSYSCVQYNEDSTTEQYTMKVSQNGNTYTVSTNDGPDETMIADGAVREVPGTVFDMQLFCQDSILYTILSGSVTDNGTTVDIKVYQAMRKNGSNVESVTTSTYLNQSITSTSVCTPN